MTLLFSELRNELESQAIVIKRLSLENSNVIFYNESNVYKISVDGVLLDEEFENILDAEAAVEEFIKLLNKEE